MSKMDEIIASFSPSGDISGWLRDVRNHFDESYGRWYSEVDDNPMSEDCGTITVEISTGGWSHNEEVVDKMLEQPMIRMLYYYSWQRGGKYVFKFYKLKP